MNVPSEQELNALLHKTSISDFRRGYIFEQGFMLPQRYLEMKNDLENFEVLDSDLWICGFPKTGTTWVSEISWLILNNFDYEGAKAADYDRTRMLDMLFDPNNKIMFGLEVEKNSLEYTRNQKSPRSIKTHLPYPLLPKQILNETRTPKIIYTARNAMDTCVSNYHQSKNIEGFSGTLEDYCTLFLFDKVNYGPYYSHVLSFWEVKEKSNILFLTYEEMRENLSGTIDKVAQHLGKSLTQEQKTTLENYVSFESMKRNPAVNKDGFQHLLDARGQPITPFIRKGKIGGYKDDISSDMISQFKNLWRKKFEPCNLNLLD